MPEGPHKRDVQDEIQDDAGDRDSHGRGRVKIGMMRREGDFCAAECRNSRDVEHKGGDARADRVVVEGTMPEKQSHKRVGEHSEKNCAGNAEESVMRSARSRLSESSSASFLLAARDMSVRQTFEIATPKSPTGR